MIFVVRGEHEARGGRGTFEYFFLTSIFLPLNDSRFPPPPVVLSGGGNNNTQLLRLLHAPMALPSYSVYGSNLRTRLPIMLAL